MKLGFIGLGTMGMPILEHLLTAGHEVAVYDVSTAAMQRAAQAGATLVEEVGDTARGAEVVFASVTNQTVLEEILCGPGGILQVMAPGSVIVDLGTTAAPKCREFAAAARDKQIGFLDAPLSGSGPWAKSGELAVMVGGDRAAFDRCRPLLELFGAVEKIFYLGESGSGQTAKLCHQLAFMGTLVGLAEAMALGERAGITKSRVLEVIGACVSPRHVIDFLRPVVESETYRDTDGGLAIFHKDLKAVLAMADDLSFSAPLAKTLFGYYEQALQAGRGDLNAFGAIQLAEEEFFTNTQ